MLMIGRTADGASALTLTPIEHGRDMSTPGKDNVCVIIRKRNFDGGSILAALAGRWLVEVNDVRDIAIKDRYTACYLRNDAIGMHGRHTTAEKRIRGYGSRNSRYTC